MIFMWKKLCTAMRLTFTRARDKIGIFLVPWFSGSFFLVAWHVGVVPFSSKGSALTLEFVITGTNPYTALYAAAVFVHVAEKWFGWKTRTRSFSHIDRVPLRDKHSNLSPIALKSLSMRRNCDDGNVKSL